ncbi:hypothetical protein [Sphingomonas oryzagri]|uniref:Uncharacterized protein n=1 Tax=Sphingomonas oryzagri TaxID=3042314 RepID=A0ABT6N778_9SPHN|nr:hypothetical protein [Sphingomonas oryzagri]MDH7640963.1 hypothetical protein [Sphingomonas oryzagri]
MSESEEGKPKTVKAPKKAPDQKVVSEADKAPRKSVRPFPAHAFSEAFEFAQAIQDASGNQPIRRITLFDQLKRSPESSASRTLITSAGKYGLVKGSYKSESLELTDRGDRATNPDQPAAVKAKARFECAIDQVSIFKSLYERYINQRLPSTAVLLDASKELGAPADGAQECIDTFISNLKNVGVLKTLSGAERVVPLEHALEQMPQTRIEGLNPLPRHNSLLTEEAANFEKTCFVVSPIGDPGSEFRRHADMILSSFIEPALQDFGLKVVRADQIAESGIITKQIAQYVWNSRLVIADLSFHNPNVFYELALRHAANKPVIQLIRLADKIPFDLQQSRTIVIDTTDHYTLVPKIDTYRAEISTHARRALEDGATTDNPLTVFLPELFMGRS